MYRRLHPAQLVAGAGSNGPGVRVFALSSASVARLTCRRQNVQRLSGDGRAVASPPRGIILIMRGRLGMLNKDL